MKNIQYKANLNKFIEIVESGKSDIDFDSEKQSGDKECGRTLLNKNKRNFVVLYAYALFVKHF